MKAGQVTRVTQPLLLEDPVTFLALPSQFIETFAGPTPDVTNLLYFYSHQAPETVTAFLNGQNGQTLCILGNGNTTVSHNSSIKTNTGVDKLLLSDIVYRFTYFGGIWYEDE